MISVSNIPNVLTTIRIIIIPVIILTFYVDDAIFSHQLAATLFVFACITDFLDGYIAKKFNLQTQFGRMLDPIADKLLVGSVLIMVIKFRKAHELPCILILSREFIILGMREFLSHINVSLPVSRLAKVKTTVQMIALAVLVLGSKGSGIACLDAFGHIILWISSILTVITGYSYIKMYVRYI